MTDADSVHSTPPINTSVNETGEPPVFRRTNITPEVSESHGRNPRSGGLSHEQ
jgi:hypothetical protein